MQVPIRVSDDFGDDSDKLLLNLSGSLVGVFTYDRERARQHTLTIHTVADGRIVGEHTFGDCRGLGFIDDDTLLIANEEEVLRWKVSGKPEKFGACGGFIYALTTRPGLPVFAVGFEAAISAMDVKTGERLWTTDRPLDLSTDSLLLSARGRFLASTHSPHRKSWRAIVVFEIATGRRLRLHLSDQYVGSMTFTPNEKALFVATGDSGDTISVYEAGCVDPVRHFSLPQEVAGVRTLFFAPRRAWLDVVDDAGALSRINPITGQLLERVGPPRHLAEIGDIAVSANGKVAAAVDLDMTVRVWPLVQDGSPK